MMNQTPARHFINMILLKAPILSGRRDWYLHITEEEMKVQKWEINFPGSHCSEVAGF